MSKTGIPVEVNERYASLVQNRWPVSVSPLPEEVLSSFLHRTALANGIAPRQLAGVLGLPDGMWSPRLELHLPRHVAASLSDHTGLPEHAILAMVMPESVLKQLVLPLRDNAGRNRSNWIQYCPICLAQDAEPYFRRHWRLASNITCATHNSGLRDRCPSCKIGICSFRQNELVPQHLCFKCGLDLRSTSKTIVYEQTRMLERSIQDMFRIELAMGWESAGRLALRVRGAPTAASTTKATTLNSLSVRRRIDCLDRLASRSRVWLTPDIDVRVSKHRLTILVARGHRNLIDRGVNFLEKHQHRPRRFIPPPEVSGLAEVLAADLDVNLRRGYR